MADKNDPTGFPKWKYPADGSAGKIVSSAQEEAALGEGWSDTPFAPSKNDQVLTVIAHLVARPDKIEEQEVSSRTGRADAPRKGLPRLQPASRQRSPDRIHLLRELDQPGGVDLI